MDHNSYTDRSRTYLTQAAEELQRDDLCQASEKGWGAAAEMVKAVATARGWDHNGHRQLFGVITRLVTETGDETFRTAFAVAGALHTNFYEGWLDRGTVEAHLDEVTRFVERMEELLGNL